MPETILALDNGKSKRQIMNDSLFHITDGFQEHRRRPLIYTDCRIVGLRSAQIPIITVSQHDNGSVDDGDSATVTTLGESLGDRDLRPSIQNER